MKLYDRDYCVLTEQEEAEWRLLKEQEIVRHLGRFPIIRSRFRDYPKAVRHYLSLFPNNYLDIVDLRNEPALRQTMSSFRALLESTEASERAILNFITENRAYFIVGGLMKKYFRFGHHDTHLFAELPLGTSYKVDYMLAGRSSGGWNLVFVELEAPLGSITVASGDLGSVFRKGLGQIADWDAWLDTHFGVLAEYLDRYRNKQEPLPSEFRLLDKTRIRYVVVAGRRSDFNDRTYRIQRKRAPSELILHYDNLVDAAEELIGTSTY